MAAPNRAVVLVTGGAGYIGSHSVKALRLAGHDVVVFDNLSAGHRGATLGAPLVLGDIRDVDAVRRALRESGATAVMHFAARLVVSESVHDPAGYYLNNVTGTLATLEAMAAEGCRQFVFSSTCAVYGEPTSVPLTESHPTVPVSPYGQTKLAVEQALPHFERAYGIRSIRLRYFNAAGADPDGELGEDHDPEIHLIPRAFDAARGGLPFELFGEDYPTPDGTCIRDYVHVTDLADAHVRALSRLLDGGASSYLQRGSRAALLGPRGARGRRAGDGTSRALHVGGPAPRRSRGPVRLVGAHSRGAWLGAAAREPRNHRRGRLEMAFESPSGVPQVTR